MTARIATRRHPRVAPAVIFAALAVVAAGCAGPREPLEIGLKEIPSQVILGSQTEDAPAAVFVPPDAFPIRLPSVPAGVAEPPRPFTPTTTPAPPPPCPSADPLSAPKVEALNGIFSPPVPSAYPFRNRGTFEISGANAQKGVLPESSTRTVKDVVDSGGGRFRFQVESVFGDTTTITGYKVEPAGTSEPGGQGLYVTAITTSAEGQSSTFDPQPDLLLLRLPVEIGNEWQSAGVDQRSGTAMAFTGTTGVKGRVDACGTFLDAHTVTINGRIGECQDIGPPDPAVPDPAPACPPQRAGQAISPESSTSFEAVYRIGTQYGGIPLGEEIVTTTEQRSRSIHRENRSTINVVPARAASR